MTDAVVSVRGLQKTYKVHERQTGVGATVRSLFKRKFKEVPAVGGIDFDIARGEIVGFLGPNGAGKTTTLKMLSGLLYPTGGNARVLGYTPGDRDYAFLRRNPLLMGNRTPLDWDLPAAVSILVLQQFFQHSLPHTTKRIYLHYEHL